MHKKAAAPKKEESGGLPPAYDPSSVEDRTYARWEASGFFNPDNLPGKRKEAFTVIMPPPNATGTLHVGHAMFMTLEDIMVRFNRMRGKAALWIPGTDHAAIATNAKVEKIIAKEGKTKYDLGREKFLGRVREFVAQSQGTIRKQIRKMGSSCDWSREAYTLDEPRSRAVRQMFSRMYRDGLIYRGYRIVNWCPHCESTLADDEVEHKEAQGTLYYLKYGPFIVATTRPETKLGDTAVAVHPGDARYEKRIGMTFSVDFGIGPQEIRVIADDGVDPKFGSGALGVTPAHSQIDFAMAEKNGLAVKKVIGEDGKMTAAAGKYSGMPVLEAREAFVRDLEAAGLIEKREPVTHNLSVCYRCGGPVEPLTSRQWFVDVNRVIPGRKGSLKTLAVDAVRKDDIVIIPERFEKVYFHWMENLRDWCISRQIWFGHRIPVWYCRHCYAPEEDAGATGSSHAGGRESKSHLGVIVSVEPPRQCPNCGREELTQDTDTLDTWFSSGMWTFSTLGWIDGAAGGTGKPKKSGDLRRFHPTSVLETGYDILFFWVARMILMTTYALGEVPFRKVYLHGLVRDEQGRKMSKSLENIINPLDVAAKYGTDAVRLSLTIGNTAGNDLRISDEKIAYFRNFANKLWNISRFIQLAGADAGQRKAPTPKTVADKWLLARLNDAIRSVTADLDALEFSRVGETLRDFTWNEFADWYLEIAKIEKGKEKMLGYALRTLLALWHPFMPFVTEEIHRLMFASAEDVFLMLASWPSTARSSSGKPVAAVKEFAVLQEIVVALRNIRSTHHVEASKKIVATIAAGAKLAFIHENAGVIRILARVEKLDVVRTAKKPKDAASAAAGGMHLFVPLGSLVDRDVERVRLDKEIAEAERYFAAQEGKLKNKDFVALAPEHVVAGERRKLVEAKDRLAKLREQRNAFGA